MGAVRAYIHSGLGTMLAAYNYDLRVATVTIAGVAVYATTMYYCAAAFYFQDPALYEYRFLALATNFIGFTILFFAAMMIRLGGYPLLRRWARTVRAAIRTPFY